MPVLKNARHERFAQNIAKGMNAAKAYEKAGYKRNDGSAGRLHRNAQVKGRIADAITALNHCSPLKIEAKPSLMDFSLSFIQACGS